MEDDCPPAKRRHILQEDHVDCSESTKDTNTDEIFNKESVVDHGDAITVEKESLTEGTQIYDIDTEQENNKSKNEIVTEESKLDAPEAAGDDDIKNEDSFCGDNGHFQFGKKLLVLDVNGLLVDIVHDPDEAYEPDAMIGSKAVFKRPFCDDFLKFCFERFNVGVWTSRTRRNIEQVLKFLGIDNQQLLFCWDQYHCTKTGFNTIENSDKPLVLKELKKLWEKQDPSLPWDRGVYNESNTIFLDDSPYKALRNPPHTAIFPCSYSYRDTHDNGLGPDGDLRNYLERLAASDNVQKFIEQNPFGQEPITYDNESWYFYRKIIGSTRLKAGPSRRKLIILDTGGLLVDVSTAPREGFRADTMQGSTAVFKRPYCEEFLQFCFKRFNVGFWTSTSRNNTESTLDFLMGDSRHKLLFCWDRSHCTDTGFGTVENNSKPLILKEVRKLWEKRDPDLSWDIGEYDESNTLLIENASHKALLNPPHTAIFPYPYRHWDTEDNSLGPEGNLRSYLERLAASENVQKFVSENPFGQRPIREKNLSWGYYQKVIHAISSRSSRWKARTNGSVDARYKNSSETKPDTTTLAAPTFLEPKADSTTVSAARTIVKTETDTTVTNGQTSLEPEADNTISNAQTSLEPETDTTMPDGQFSLEPEGDTTIPAAQTSLKSEADMTVPDAQTLLKPEGDTTIPDAQTSLEPEADTSITDGQTSLKPEGGTTIPDAQTSLEPEVDTIIPDAQTSLEPEASASTTDAQTSLEPEAGTSTTDAQTSLEPEAGTSITDAQTSLKPEDDTTIPDAQTSLEPEADTTIPDAQTSLEPEAGTSITAAQTPLDSEADTTMPDAQTSLEPQTDRSTVIVAKTALSPQTDTSRVLASPN